MIDKKLREKLLDTGFPQKAAERTNKFGRRIIPKRHEICCRYFRSPSWRRLRYSGHRN